MKNWDLVAVALGAVAGAAVLGIEGHPVLGFFVLWTPAFHALFTRGG